MDFAFVGIRPRDQRQEGHGERSHWSLIPSGRQCRPWHWRPNPWALSRWSPLLPASHTTPLVRRFCRLLGKRCASQRLDPFQKKFLSDICFYIWDAPFLFQCYANGILRRCILEDKILAMLHDCHGSHYAGHFGASCTTARVLEFNFYWPTIFKDAQDFTNHCGRCQCAGNISRRDELLQLSILEVELFNIWGDRLHGPFPAIQR